MRFFNNKPSRAVNPGRMEDNMYNIYMQAGLTVYIFASFDNYDDALEFCELYNWEYIDENGFQWSLDLDAM